MGDHSAIEWTDATWNPIRGTKGRHICERISPGCRFCYAARMNVRLSRIDYVAGADDPRLDETALQQPLAWKRPRRIFVCSMTDLFWERVEHEWVLRILDVIERSPQHTFQILTKRAERMYDFFGGSSGAGEGAPALPHLWLGISAERQRELVDRWRWLERTPAAVRWISGEPLLGPLNLERALPHRHGGCGHVSVDWVVTGGESGGWRSRRLVDYDGPRGEWIPKREALEWVRAIRDQCQAAGAAFFHKQWGGPTPTSGGRLLDGQEWSQYPR